MNDHDKMMFEDRVQSAMAVTQQIQNRLLQSACKGKLIGAGDLPQLCKSLHDIIKSIDQQKHS